MSTVGIHIIMKDESEWLRQCLESVRDADEIIVIDTGSQDSSVDIAKSYGAKVFFSKWEDDFSKPRNQALQHAKTDWICYLDADEALLSGMAAIKKQVNDTTAEAFTVILENVIGLDLQDHLLHRSIRLFRNDPSYRFQGIIHEEIEPSIVKKSPGASIPDSEIRIRHYGYLPDNLQKKNKVVRNEFLLKKALHEEPANPFYLYNLGITCCQAEKIEAAKDLMIQALALTPENAPYRSTLVKDLSKILIELGEVKQVETLLLKETERYEDYPDLHFILGQSLGLQGLWEQAYEQFHKATTFQTNNYVTEAGVSTHLAFYQLAEIARKLEQPEEAARLFNHALQHHKTYAPALLGIAEVFYELNVSFHEIAAFLKEKVNPSTPSEYLSLVDSLLQLGAYEQAIAYTPKILLTEPRILTAYCRSLMHIDKLDEADRILQVYLTDQTNTLEYDMLVQWRAICQWQLVGGLQADFLAALPERLHALYSPINEHIRMGSISAESLIHPNSWSELADSIARHSIDLGQLQLVEKMFNITEPHRIELSKMLYLQGYILQAAEQFIRLLKANQLDDEGLFYLGEILLDKGHYLQAAEMFESMVPTDRKHEQSKTAASICYLRLAESSLSVALTSAPDASALKEDLQQIRSGIRLLNRTCWHTKWTGRQRGILGDQKHDIAVHDREK